MNERFIVPSGSGFGGKSGSKGGGINESPNTLKSKQIAKIVDLLGEGPISGIVDGLQGVAFDTVRVGNADGTMNFIGFGLEYTTGTPDQLPLTGFPGIVRPYAVGVQIKTTTPHTVNITDLNVNRVRLTMSVPALAWTDTKSGLVSGNSVAFEIYIQRNGAGYLLFAPHAITGKTTGRYQRALTIPLDGQGPWDIRIVRLTADSTTQTNQNDLYWDSYEELIDSRIRYRNSAVVGISVDAEQFSSIPNRIYDVNGLLIQFPTNYDSVPGTYVGAWDGTFQVGWTNNPAWVFYDLVTNDRYGLGSFLPDVQVDKWALYSIAQWCDVRVPDGKGNLVKRWTCNAVIADRQEAHDLIQSMASVFRGAHYWAGGMLTAVADMPADTIGQYTNANVINGEFIYAGSDRRARHTQVAVAWNDANNFGQPRIALVEDTDGIARYGLQRTDIVAIGCTEESQAIRIGKWTLYSELYETETVSFSVGVEGAWCRPGDVIRIADITIAGERRGGRVVSATTTSVRLDGPIVFHEPGASIICMTGRDGQLQVLPIIIPALEEAYEAVNVDGEFTMAPEPDSVWVIVTGDLMPTLWRVISIEEDDLVYKITALSHDRGKWDYVEKDIIPDDRDVTNIGRPTIKNLQATEYLVALSVVSVGAMVNLTWESTAAQFDVEWRKVDANWQKVRTTTTAQDIPVEAGTYDFKVTPIDLGGFKGTPARLTKQLFGLLARPADVIRFRAQLVGKMLTLGWAPATDLDVIIGGWFELRYSPVLVGVTWASSVPVVMQIPGSATTVEVPHRPGTYLIKAMDSSGIRSANAAVIISYAPDSDIKNFFRIQEHTGFTGTKQNVEIQNPQQWLVLGQTGGLIDDQGTFDAIPNFDVLAYGVPPPSLDFGEDQVGVYTFANRIDMGIVCSTVLTVEMLAFPFTAQPTDYLDTRPGNVDEYQDWDSGTGDATGQVMIQVRQTNDNPAGSPTWTAYQPFVAGEYVARAYEFQAVLVAPQGQQVAIENLSITADVRAKSDKGNDVIWPASTTSLFVPFNIPFYTVPALSVLIQDGTQNDVPKILSKTRLGFTFEIRNSAGNVVNTQRIVDFIAVGY